METERLASVQDATTTGSAPAGSTIELWVSANLHMLPLLTAYVRRAERESHSRIGAMICFLAACRFATTKAVQTSNVQAFPRVGRYPNDPSRPARQLPVEVTSEDTAASQPEPQVNASDEHGGWTKWSIGNPLQILRNGSPSATTEELRKLHIHWWHATVTQMQHMWGQAGLPHSVLNACRGRSEDVQTMPSFREAKR